MAELPDLAYNQSIPSNWWESDLWTPTRFAYGDDVYGQTFGPGTTNDDCEANNAYIIMKYLKALGWSFQTICALLGNYQSESHLDPRNWERQADPTGGFGLPQWTPQSQYQGWGNTIWGQSDPFAPYYYNGYYELYIQASEVFNYPNNQWKKHTDDPQGNPSSGSSYYPGYPDSGPPDQSYWINFADWCRGRLPSSISSVNSRLDYLTGAYYWNYEQVADYVADYSLPQRRNRARSWYQKFLRYYGDFPGRQVVRPTKPDPDYTIADIKARYPAWYYKILYMASHREGAWSQYAR